MATVFRLLELHALVLPLAVLIPSSESEPLDEDEDEDEPDDDVLENDPERVERVPDEEPLLLLLPLSLSLSLPLSLSRIILTDRGGAPDCIAFFHRAHAKPKPNPNCQIQAEIKTKTKTCKK